MQKVFSCRQHNSPEVFNRYHIRSIFFFFVIATERNKLHKKVLFYLVSIKLLK